jgi:hypothetical protein
VLKAGSDWRTLPCPAKLRHRDCEDVLPRFETGYRPGGVDGLVEQRFLDRDQQMVGPHAQEDVCFGATLGVMEDRAFGELRFNIAKRRSRHG